MTTVFFTTNIDIVDEWKNRHNIESNIICTEIEELLDTIANNTDHIIIADYDTVSTEINSLISSNSLPDKLIVLEKSPAIATGKLLILRGAKAYGNSRMHNNHYTQMINTVLDGKIWTYPKLTNSLIEYKNTLNKDSIEIIKNRLSETETKVLYLILDGLSNNAIASSLNITTRTVKAHVSSIFHKLHVNDRVSLILLLK